MRAGVWVGYCGGVNAKFSIVYMHILSWLDSMFQLQSKVVQFSTFDFVYNSAGVWRYKAKERERERDAMPARSQNNKVYYFLSPQFLVTLNFLRLVFHCPQEMKASTAKRRKKKGKENTA